MKGSPFCSKAENVVSLLAQFTELQPDFHSMPISEFRLSFTF